jgi:hypothetical protein
VMLDDSKGIESFSESATIGGRDLARDMKYNNRTTFPSRGQPKAQASREQQQSDFCTAILLLDRTGGLRQIEPCAR